VTARVVLQTDLSTETLSTGDETSGKSMRRRNRHHLPERHRIKSDGGEGESDGSARFGDEGVGGERGVEEFAGAVETGDR